MNIYDISTPLSKDLVTWPGEDSLERTVLKTVKRDGVEVSRISIGSHTGTHIDAPLHFVEDGGGLDSIDLEKCVGSARVLDVTSVEGDIDVEDLASHNIQSGERVLFKTQSSIRKLLDDPDFHEDYVALTSEAAKFLADIGVVFVGVDYLSIERKGIVGHPTHVTLLKKEIVILEGARLIDVDPGDYELVALPLNIPDGDGVSVRAVLIQRES